MKARLYLLDDPVTPAAPGAVHLAGAALNDPPVCWIETVCGVRIEQFANLHEATMRAVGITHDETTATCPACRAKAR